MRMFQQQARPPTAYAEPECVPTMAVPRVLVLVLLPVAALAVPTLVDVAAVGPAFAAVPAKHGGGRAAEHRAPHGLRSLDRGAPDRGAPGRGAPGRRAAGRGAADHGAAARGLAPGRSARFNPYAGHGLTIVLPDGRHVRFIEPAPPSPAAPPAPPAGSPPSTAPTAAASAAPGPSGRGTGADPGDAVSESRTVLPVPVIQSLFPPLTGGAAGGATGGAAGGATGGATGGSGAPAAASAPGAPPASGAPPNGGTAAADGTPIGRTGAGTPAAGGAASAAAPASATATATARRLPSDAAAGAHGTAGDAAAPAPAVGPIAPGWPPMPAGPPPLGPQSLAHPQPVDLVPPRTADADYGGTLRHRLLPLGLGLALIGAGAALFGWKLRRL